MLKFCDHGSNYCPYFSSLLMKFYQIQRFYREKTSLYSQYLNLDIGRLVTEKKAFKIKIAKIVIIKILRKESSQICFHT